MLVSGVQQSDQSYIYVYLVFFRFLSHIVDCRILGRVSCAIYNRSLLIIYFIILLIYSCCVGSLLLPGIFSSCGKWGLFLTVVCGLLMAVASLVVEHRL